jgi:hypothetical protein
MSKFTRWALVGLIALSTSGCYTQWRYDLGDHLTRPDLDQLKTGMPMAEVLAVFGPPQRLSSSVSGYILAWEHWQVDEDSLGFRLGAVGADLLSLDWGNSRIRGEFLLVTFDRDYRLSGSTVSEWDSSAGGGQGIQPIASFLSTVDVGDLVRRLPQHDWGANYLRELPQALNTPSSPTSGEAGMQQRGTPPNVGQRSLELQ